MNNEALKAAIANPATDWTEEQLARSLAGHVNQEMQRFGGSAEYAGIKDGMVHIEAALPPVLQQITLTLPRDLKQ